MGETATPGSDADLLARLHNLPPQALLNTFESAAYIRSTVGALRTWRYLGRGPKFVGRGRFIRYRKADLDAFVSGHDQRGYTSSDGDAI